MIICVQTNPPWKPSDSRTFPPHTKTSLSWRYEMRAGDVSVSLGNRNELELEPILSFEKFSNKISKLQDQRGTIGLEILLLFKTLEIGPPQLNRYLDWILKVASLQANIPISSQSSSESPTLFFFSTTLRPLQLTDRTRPCRHVHHFVV
ncbi:LOW QUALITY PROTEIN: hypothetical protein BC937DRAFT_93293 [Endogone sp. FLAS-F59071]|nr:LOW QUALITY PROTEIN: hypothetical protein BC937DRAFT_93293 [Endogone sp. FLAS-F59071]|eukprot:RUS21219.1 LOW QUALITY PROTEIN: hypothetical protein BC937DRAFT_93293 [Endogone sp. FLAS-F59071]